MGLNPIPADNGHLMYLVYLYTCYFLIGSIFGSIATGLGLPLIMGLVPAVIFAFLLSRWVELKLRSLDDRDHQAKLDFDESMK